MSSEHDPSPRVDRAPAPRGRSLRTAEILAVGSELTAGETRDTNGGELARALTLEGVAVGRISALPDDLALVRRAFREALAGADLVVATGGLGPTPDDLTREAFAEAIGEEPSVDPGLEAWLRGLFARRGMALPAMNLKQAWLVPSAIAIPNENGTAPGWWVERPDGRLAVLLPGPPREMRPMWSGWAMPRLRARGLGEGRLVRTLRTYGIGESSAAELLGEELLRAANPVVATYARSDWLDVRVSAVDELDESGRVVRPATEALEAAAKTVRARLDGYVRAEGDTSWADLVAAAAAGAGVRFAVAESGTHGALGALLADVPALARETAFGPLVSRDVASWPVETEAAEIAAAADAEVGLSLVAHADGAETFLRAAVAAPGAGWSRVLELRLFQHGPHGRFRAAVSAAAFLVEVLAERR